LDRLKLIQHKVIEIILKEMKKNDKERDISLEEEIIHSMGCCRLAQIVALKRKLDAEIAGVIGAAHDYGRIITGKKKNHAEKAVEPLRRLLQDTDRFSASEIELIIKAVANHSNKKEIQGHYDELIKDVDVLDNYFSGKVRDKEEYQKRLSATLKELNLPGI